MSNELSIIIGAMIGGSISVISTLIQQKKQSSRELIKIAYELAIKDFEKSREWIKPGQGILPLESFFTYYMQYIKLVKRRSFKIKDLDKIRHFRSELSTYYKNEEKIQSQIIK